MKILITGATGYIGSHLTSHLVGKDYDIAVLLREDSKTTLLSKHLNTIQIYRTNGSFADLVRIIEAFHPEVVIHLASLFLSQHHPEQVEELINSNILFPTTLVEAMATFGVSKLINTGTSWQHYENADYNPVNLYAATKQSFEDICEYYSRAMKIKIITLKLFETYGPGDPRKKLIPLLLKCLTTKQTLKLSPGDQKLDLVHIQDICTAYETALNQISKMKHPDHLKYGISSGSHIRIRDLVGMIEKVSRENLTIIWGGRPYRDREIFHPWSKFDPLPAWKPKISLEKGLRSLILKSFN